MPKVSKKSQKGSGVGDKIKRVQLSIGKVFKNYGKNSKTNIEPPSLRYKQDVTSEQKFGSVQYRVPLS